MTTEPTCAIWTGSSVVKQIPAKDMVVSSSITKLHGFSTPRALTYNFIINKSKLNFNIEYITELNLLFKCLFIFLFILFFIQVKWQLRKSEAGNKGSKLQRVEINISIDSLKVIDAKSHVKELFIYFVTKIMLF